MLIVILVISSGGRSTVIQLGRNGVGNVLDLLKFLLKVISGSRLTFRVDPASGVLDGVQERRLVIGIQLATETVRVTELGLETVNVGRQGVESFYALLLGLVLGRELFSLGNHTIDLVLSKTSLLVGDSDRLGFTGTLVGSGDLHDTIGVNLEGNLDLGNTAWSGRDAGELELAKEVVVLCEGAFTLEDLDQDGGLVVGSGGEDLALAGGDDGVTGDELGHDTTGGLDTKSEGVDIDEDDITQALVTGKDTALNGGTISNSLIGVDALGRLLSEVLLEELLDLGNTSGTTDEDDLQYMLVGFAMTVPQEN